jgi:TonB-dependent receptor
MKTKIFNKTPLAASLSIILGASLMAPAINAQEADTTDDTEIIEVTGIRGSMIKSMDIKRSSSGIVDAINAEEMGKFPDSNLAESLQRVTGISIERSNGEGAKVSARGFGPDRNLVTLNGRSMPTTTGERNFDFSNLAAEGVSGVEIYKTSKADVPTGGIGATINILTHKPLSNPGQKATFAIEALDDATTQKGGITPQFSGLYSNTTDDGMFGIALSASYSERESGSQQSQVRHFFSFAADSGNALDVPMDATQTNRYAEGDIVSVPQEGLYLFEEQQRKRTNAQLTLQYRPLDNVTATLDYTYVNKENDTQNNQISSWFTGSDINVWSNGPNVSPLIYSQIHDTPSSDSPLGYADLAIGAGDFSIKDGSKSLGLNIEYQVTDDLAINFDHHESSASGKPNGILGSGNAFQMRALVRQSTAVDFTGDRPVLSVVGASNAAAADFQFTGSNFNNTKNDSHISQTQINGEYLFEGASSIDFGVALTTSQNRSRYKEVVRNQWQGEGPTGLVGDDLFTSVSIADRFGNLNGGNFADFDGDIEILSNYFEFDFRAVRDIAVANLAVNPDNIGDCGNSLCPSTDYSSATDQYTKEEMAAVYVQYNYEGELGDMFYDVHLGLRYEETEIVSTSAVPQYRPSALWEGNTELSLVATGDRTFGTREGSYDHLLPSINFNINVTDDIVLRTAYSKTIGRPRYNDMIGGLNLGTAPRVGPGGTGDSGSPGLLPLESTNIDFSAEWYYAEGSYVSLGYFTKDVENDLAITNRDLTANIYNPGSGPYQREALAAVGTDLALQRDYIFETYGATDPNVFKDNTGKLVIRANPATDDLLNFVIATPTNRPGSTGYSGFEFAVQHLFGESGFGGIINYTVTDTDNEFDNLLISDTQVAEVGISDSANIVAFYEKDGFSIRGAYNWRSKYIVATSQGPNSTGPRYIEEYAQLDITMSYDVPQVKGLNVYLNGINITEENLSASGRNENQVLAAIQQGARWSVGARYSF